MANPGKESGDDEGGEIRKNLSIKIKNWGSIRNYHLTVNTQVEGLLLPLDI